MNVFLINVMLPYELNDSFQKRNNLIDLKLLNSILCTDNRQAKTC